MTKHKTVNLGFQARRRLKLGYGTAGRPYQGFTLDRMCFFYITSLKPHSIEERRDFVLQLRRLTPHSLPT